MYRLILLGGTDLRHSDGHRVHSVLHQPKRFAVLAHLALASRSGAVARDAILPFFWPESDDARARQNLKQAVYKLRQSLGPRCIISEGPNHLRVDSDVLGCDAIGFQESVAKRDWQAALAVYQGDLLPGFFLDGCGEFERWLDDRRTLLRRQAADAAGALAEEELDRGRNAAAVEMARLAAQLAELNEPMVRRALELLARAGDRAGAHELYSTFSARLNDELGVDPSPETVALGHACVDGAPSVGAQTHKYDSTDSETANLRVGPASRRHPWRPRSPGQAAAAAVAILVLAVVPFLNRASAAGEDERLGVDYAPAMVTIAPFLLLSDGPDESDPFVFRSSLARDLARSATVHVIWEGDTTRAAEGVSGAVRSHRPGIRLSVGGRFHVRDGRVAVEAILVDEASQRVLDTVSIESGEADAPDAVRIAARETADWVRVAIGRIVTGVDDTNWELVKRAEGIRIESRRLRAIGAAEAAAGGFAAADSILAWVEVQEPAWVEPPLRRAMIAADKGWLAYRAPADNPELARAHFEAGLEHAERAAAIDPDNPAVLESRGSIAFWTWRTVGAAGDRSLELASLAEADLRQAVVADPGRPRAWSILSDLSRRRGDFPGSYWAAYQALLAGLDRTTTVEVLMRLFEGAHEIGDDAKARHWCDEVGRTSASSWPILYCELAILAWADWVDDGALQAAQEHLDRADPVSPAVSVYLPRLEMMVAAIAASNGFPDRAEQGIARARADGDPDPELLQLEAHARLRLGQLDTAAALLAKYIAPAPDRRAVLLHTRRFGPIRSYSALQEWLGENQQAWRSSGGHEALGAR